MNKLTMPLKPIEVRVETASPLHCVTRFLPCFFWALFLVTPASRLAIMNASVAERLRIQQEAEGLPVAP